MALVTRVASTTSELVRTWPATAASCAALLMASACIEMPRERVETLADRGYPTCPGDATLAQVEPVQRELRAGPVMTEQSVVETFSLTADHCLVVYTGHEEWAMGATDLEIVYDADRRPLRAYRRATAPGPHAPSARTDVRVFDLRGPHVELMRRAPLGEIERLVYRAASPGVIIATGRGALTPWIQRSHLSVGGRVRESALDIRERIEIVRDVTLRREEDRDDSRIGHVRVYTIYGREPIYTDDHDVIIGDMMGLVPASLVDRPRDPPVLTDGPPTPREPFAPH
jgi:hypothetical protein